MNRRFMIIAGMLFVAVALLINSTWIHAKAILAQYLIESAWQQTLEGHQRVRPWSWADTWPVAKLTLAKNKPLYVLNGATGSPLAFGPGYHRGSVKPGSKGLSVIAGHRDTHFRQLEALQRGDNIQIENTEGEIIDYLVSNIEIIDSSKEQLNLRTQQTLLKLITCYPFDAVTPGGPQRYVVSAVPKSKTVEL